VGRELTTEEANEIQVMGERLQEMAREVDATVISVHGPNHPGKENTVYSNVHANWHPESVKDTASEGGGYTVWATWDSGMPKATYIHAEYPCDASDSDDVK
jgi:hypothetical protein